jgi:hypothetical protein
MARLPASADTDNYKVKPLSRNLESGASALD